MTEDYNPEPTRWQALVAIAKRRPWLTIAIAAGVFAAIAIASFVVAPQVANLGPNATNSSMHIHRTSHPNNDHQSGTPTPQGSDALVPHGGKTETAKPRPAATPIHTYTPRPRPTHHHPTPPQHTNP